MGTEEKKLSEFNLTVEDSAALDEILNHSSGNRISKTSQVLDQQNNEDNINGFDEVDLKEKQYKSLCETHSFDFSNLISDDTTKKSFEKTDDMHQKMISSDSNSLRTVSSSTPDNSTYYSNTDGCGIEDDIFENEFNSLSADSADDFLRNLQNEIDELDCKSLTLSSLTSQPSLNKKVKSSSVESNKDLNFATPESSDQSRDSEIINPPHGHNNNLTNFRVSIKRKKSVEDQINNKKIKDGKNNNKLLQSNTKHDCTKNLWLSPTTKNEG